MKRNSHRRRILDIERDGTRPAVFPTYPDNFDGRKLQFAALDRFKFAAALLVIAIHTGPLMSRDPYADFLLTSIAARVAVPFFFMASAFFFFRKWTEDQRRNRETLRRFLHRIAALYLLSIVLYLPLNVYVGYFGDELSIVSAIRDIVFDGTFYHLWYLPALMLGMVLTYVLRQHFGWAPMLMLAGGLYVIGLLGDSYYGLAERSVGLSSAYAAMFTWFDYTRNGLFFAPVFLALGAYAAQQSGKSRPADVYGISFLLTMALMFAEGIMLHKLGMPRHDSMYVFLVPAVYCLFQWLRWQRGTNGGRFVRQLSTWIYIVHPIAIVLVRGISKLIGLTAVLVLDSLVHFVAVTALSIGLSVGIVYIERMQRRTGGGRHASVRRAGNHSSEDKAGADHSSDLNGCHRAWAEIRLDHLQHNVLELQRALPSGCELIAVVKADAYGHGSIRVASYLNSIGVERFAVAEIGEGIALRKNGVRGDIVILGYTPPECFRELSRYQLTQTMISADYGRTLDEFGQPLQVQVKIDTGMNRLGEHYSHMEQIVSMYRHSNLHVAGTFTHLAAADSRAEGDIAFTHMQMDRFNQVIEQLKIRGINPGVLHVQSSFGILNYPDAVYGLARAGIALYDPCGTGPGSTYAHVELRSVLTLKARVTLVKPVEAGMPIGYDRRYVTARDNTIAIVSIGYADGIPRQWSECGGYVLVRGKQAPIVGLICMDQLMIDVTAIEGVQRGDAVTLIGQDGDETITAGHIADRCGTIANDVLANIGGRVNRVYQIQ